MKAWIQIATFLMLVGMPNAALADNANIVRTAQGEYSYINQDTGEIVGHEDWSMLVDRSGARTFTIAQRWDERDYVTRTIFRVDANLRPIESFQTRWDDKGWMSSGVYTVVENTVTAVVTGRGGRATQTLEVPEKFSMVPHPLTTDGLHFWYVDSPIGETIEGTAYNVKKRDELSGGILGVVHPVELTYLGVENVTTAAGTFETKHFKMGDDSDFWIDARDGILVRLSYSPEGTRYDLTAFERDD
ncbi:MAG: hypothetical protein HN793_09250 [Rhodospirillaceae bacterium]|nr:hypothetical protein [Rhodospirillaceae bacterium]MBT6089545.1 hypothetical protein [Rhodospirillaceae bacterium]MBT7451003.1 hypothetical protein [Rhodospirillaceae bacterium]